jgi:hypothetical protein
MGNESVPPTKPTNTPPDVEGDPPPEPPEITPIQDEEEDG